MLDIASGPESKAIATAVPGRDSQAGLRRRGEERTSEKVAADQEDSQEKLVVQSRKEIDARGRDDKYATTFLTQFEVLAGREWKNLKRYPFLYRLGDIVVWT